MPTYRIHPGLGIARVGNSPDEFFVGPERPGEQPDPIGGFKDAQCRVKRQAARFRIFVHNDDGSHEEIDDSVAEIEWTVHLVNKKAAFDSRNSESIAAMTIDPGTRTLSGPGEVARFDTGTIDFAETSPVTVPLGEMRTETNNTLLVLGGFGKAASPVGSRLSGVYSDDWYDDISDGPVTASIRLRATGERPSVLGAWIIVAPPKFAPQIDSVVTLYDKLLQLMIWAGFEPEPTTTSYTQDIYPILRRARDARWVREVPTTAHRWTDPVDGPQRSAIVTAVAELDMPPQAAGAFSSGETPMTDNQNNHIARWGTGAFAADWPPGGPPPPETEVTPGGMDRAALEGCVGAPLAPGYETGGDAVRPLLNRANYAEKFRLDPTRVLPGDLTAPLPLPWQSDFAACGDDWWPVPHPNQVIPEGTSTYVEWANLSAGEMVNDWHSLGFVARRGTEQREVERCVIARVRAQTASLNFQDIRQGPMGMQREAVLAIEFEVTNATEEVILEYAPGRGPSHAQLAAVNDFDRVGPTDPGGMDTARLWIRFTTGPVGAIETQFVVVQQRDTERRWTVRIDGNTLASRKASTVLVLDRSGSMVEDRGDGEAKHVSVRQAAGIFADLMFEGDGLGIVGFNHDPQMLQEIVPLDAPGASGGNREATRNVLDGDGLDPDGQTSIGDGIYMASRMLEDESPDDIRALVVLTDGKENSERMIAEVASDIDGSTHAIAFGTPANTRSAALDEVTRNNRGHMLITGAIDAGSDNAFLLQKYFVQVLSEISSADVILDPDGALFPGEVRRIPFEVTRHDSGLDVILLTPHPDVVDFRLETPSGYLLEPWRAREEVSMRHVRSDGVSFYRLVLPTALARRVDHSGTWHALLRIGKPRDERGEGRDGTDWSIQRPPDPIRSRSKRFPRLELERLRRELASSSAALLDTALAAQPFDARRGPRFPRDTGSKQRALPYSVVVHAYSNLSFHVSSQQTGYEPGAVASIVATLSRSGSPFPPDAQVWAEVHRPDRSRTELRFSCQGAGRYTAKLATEGPGVYRMRVRAQGLTERREAFSRERTVTVSVWHGGDRDAAAVPTAPSAQGARARSSLELLKCLLREGGAVSPELEKRLRSAGLDLDAVRACLKLLAGNRDDGGGD